MAPRIDVQPWPDATVPGVYFVCIGWDWIGVKGAPKARRGAAPKVSPRRRPHPFRFPSLDKVTSTGLVLALSAAWDAETMREEEEEETKKEYSSQG